MMAVFGVAIAGAPGTRLGVAGFVIVWIGVHRRPEPWVDGCAHRRVGSGEEARPISPDLFEPIRLISPTEEQHR